MLKKAETLEILATYSANKGIKVTAGVVQDNLSDMFRKRIVERKDSSFLYFIARAVTAEVPNKNHDMFPLDEIKEHYMTFVDRCLFLDHNAKKVENAVGKVVAAELRQDDSGETYVACLCRVDRWLQPHICRMIEAGTINSVSMGANVAMAECSLCGCKASKESDFCEHMRNPALYDSYSINHGVEFTELSLVSVPADPSAKMSKVFDLHHDLAKTADAVQGKDPMSQTPTTDQLPGQEDVQTEQVAMDLSEMPPCMYQIDCASNEAADHIFNILHSGLNKGLEELTIAGKTIKLKMDADVEDHFEYLRELLSKADMFLGTGTMTEEDVLAVQSSVAPLLNKLASSSTTRKPHKTWNLIINDEPVEVTMFTYKGSGSGIKASSPVLAFNIAKGSPSDKRKFYEKINTDINKATAGYFQLKSVSKANNIVSAADLPDEYKEIRDPNRKAEYDAMINKLVAVISDRINTQFSDSGWIKSNGEAKEDKEDKEDKEQSAETQGDSINDLYVSYKLLDTSADSIKDAFKNLDKEQQTAFLNQLEEEDAGLKQELENLQTTDPVQTQEEPKTNEEESQKLNDAATKVHNTIVDPQDSFEGKFADVIKKLANKLASSRVQPTLKALNINPDINKGDLAKYIVKVCLQAQGREEEAKDIKTGITEDQVSAGTAKALGDRLAVLIKQDAEHTDTKKEQPKQEEPKQQEEEKQEKQEAPKQEELQQDQDQGQPEGQAPDIKPTFTAEGLTFTLQSVDGVKDVKDVRGINPKSKPLYTKRTYKGKERFFINKDYTRNIIQMLARNESNNVDLGMGDNVPFYKESEDAPITFTFNIKDSSNEALFYILEVDYTPGQPFIYNLLNRTKSEAFPKGKRPQDKEGLTAKSFKAVIYLSVYQIYKDFNQDNETAMASSDLLSVITNSELKPVLPSPDASNLSGQIPCEFTVEEHTFKDDALTLMYSVEGPKITITYNDVVKGQKYTRAYVWENGNLPHQFNADLYDYFLNIGQYIIKLYFKDQGNGKKQDTTK